MSPAYLFILKCFSVYKCFAFVGMCAPGACLVPAEARRTPQIPGVTDSCELHHMGYLGPNLGPLE